jgi:hypothetical protein
MAEEPRRIVKVRRGTRVRVPRVLPNEKESPAPRKKRKSTTKSTKKRSSTKATCRGYNLTIKQIQIEIKKILRGAENEPGNMIGELPQTEPMRTIVDKMTLHIRPVPKNKQDWCDTWRIAANDDDAPKRSNYEYKGPSGDLPKDYPKEIFGSLARCGTPYPDCPDDPANWRKREKCYIDPFTDIPRCFRDMALYHTDLQEFRSCTGCPGECITTKDGRQEYCKIESDIPHGEEVEIGMDDTDEIALGQGLPLLSFPFNFPTNLHFAQTAFLKWFEDPFMGRAMPKLHYDRMNTADVLDLSWDFNVPIPLDTFLQGITHLDSSMDQWTNIPVEIGGHTLFFLKNVGMFSIEHCDGSKCTLSDNDVQLIRSKLNSEQSHWTIVANSPNYTTHFVELPYNWNGGPINIGNPLPHEIPIRIPLPTEEKTMEPSDLFLVNRWDARYTETFVNDMKWQYCYADREGGCRKKQAFDKLNKVELVPIISIDELSEQFRNLGT